MNSSWSSVNQVEQMQGGALLSMEHVLLDYDGPKIATFTRGDTRYLGVAADNDDYFERWILARVSSVQLRGIGKGEVGFFASLFNQEDLIVADIQYGQSITHWRLVSRSIIPVEMLPQENASAPPIDIAAVQKVAVPIPLEFKRCFVFDGMSVSSKGMPFTSLSGLMSSTQRLWSAIHQDKAGLATKRGKTANASSADLYFNAKFTGSFGIGIATEGDAIFDSIASEYSVIIRKGMDRKLFTEYLRDKSGNPRLLSALCNHIEEITKCGVDVLCRWDSDDIVFQRSSAGRMLEWAKREINVSTTKVIRGHLVALNIRVGSFTFMAADEEDSIVQGHIDPKLLLQLSDKAETPVSLSVFYNATVEEMPSDSQMVEKSKYLLVDLKRYELNS